MSTNTRDKSIGEQLVLAAGPANSKLLYEFQSGGSTGAIATQPKFIFGRALNSTVAALLTKGMFVVLAGFAAPAIDEQNESALFDVAPAGTKPDYVIEEQNGMQLVLREVEGDIEKAAAVVGADYIVGTDGLAAKAGDTNYPSGATTPYVVGVGFPNSRIMLGKGSRAGAANLSKISLVDSAAITGIAFAEFDKKATIDTRALLAGDGLSLTALIELSAPALTKFQARVKLGGTVIATFAALDPVNAGDTMSIKLDAFVVTPGDPGAVKVMATASLKGDTAVVSSDANSAANIAVDLSSDLTDITIEGLFDVAGVNSAKVTLLRVRPHSGVESA